MTMPLHRFAGPEPACCAVCRRQAGQWGYSPRAHSPILWLCSDPVCLGSGSKVYTMSEREMTIFEIKARNEAGAKAGAYLDKIGRTDLGTLNEEEWFRFLTLVVTGFEDSLREQLCEPLALASSQ